MYIPFYHDQHSSESKSSQWTKYLQNTSYVKEINSTQEKGFKSINYTLEHQTNAINSAIAQADQNQSQVIQDATKAICGILNEGIEHLSKHLEAVQMTQVKTAQAIVGSVNALSHLLDWKLSVLIQEQQNTNLFLKNIAVLMRIPDIEKERYACVEKGIRFMINAVHDNDLYEHALEQLYKAESLDPTDYFTLHMIGMVHLFSLDHIDVEKANEYFQRAAKYAVAETRPGSRSTMNYLAYDLDLSQDLTTQAGDKSRIAEQAGESFFFTGITHYINGEFTQAHQAIRQGIEVVPDRLDAEILYAKFLVADGKSQTAIPILEGVVKEQPTLLLNIVADLDLGADPMVLTMVRRLLNEKVEELRSILTEAEHVMIEYSEAKPLIASTKDVLENPNYLAILQAIEELNTTRTWKVYNYVEKADNGEWVLKIESSKELDLSLPELVILERFCIDNLAMVQQLIQQNNLIQEEQSRRWEEEARKEKIKACVEAGIKMLLPFGMIGAIAGAIIIGPLTWALGSTYMTGLWGATLVAAGLGFVFGYFIENEEKSSF